MRLQRYSLQQKIPNVLNEWHKHSLGTASRVAQGLKCQSHNECLYVIPCWIPLLPLVQLHAHFSVYVSVLPVECSYPDILDMVSYKSQNA